MSGMIRYDADGEDILPRSRIPRGRRLARTFEFEQGRGPGRLTLELGFKSLAAVQREMAKYHKSQGTKADDSTEPPENLRPLPAAGEKKQWRGIGPIGHTCVSHEVDAEDCEWVRMGNLLLARTEDGVVACQAVSMRKTDDDSKWEMLNDPDVELDARVMAIVRDPSGKRSRPFREAVTLLTETAWEAWPVKGPRTFRWCCLFIAERAIHPLQHHAKFLQVTGLPANDLGAQEHEHALRVIETALCYDQVQGSELGALELIVRKAQLIELRHKDRVLNSQSSQQQTVDDDSHLYLGTGATRGMLMICPDLEKHVADELSRETAAVKERRKMREERAANPAKKK